MTKNIISFEEFETLTKEDASRLLKAHSTEEIEKMLSSDDAKDFIKNGYKSLVNAYERGDTNIVDDEDFTVKNHIDKTSCCLFMWF